MTNGDGDRWATPGNGDEQRQGFLLAFEAAPLSLEQVWLKYFGLGGEAGLTEVQAYVYGALNFPALERDLLAHALNESLNGLGLDGHRASYSTNIYPTADEGEPETH